MDGSIKLYLQKEVFQYTPIDQKLARSGRWPKMEFLLRSGPMEIWWFWPKNEIVATVYFRLAQFKVMTLEQLSRQYTPIDQKLARSGRWPKMEFLLRSGPMEIWWFWPKNEIVATVYFRLAQFKVMTLEQLSRQYTPIDQKLAHSGPWPKMEFFDEI